MEQTLVFNIEDFLKTRRILIADDDAETRGVLVANLCSLGSRREFVEITSAEDHTTSESIEDRFDVVFMSELPSVVFPLKLRASSIFIWTPKRASPADLARAVELGFHGALYKPYSKARLLSTIERLSTGQSKNESYLHRVIDAVSLQRDGYPEEATEILRDALTLHPRPALALAYLADMHQAQGQHQQARDYLERSIQANPDCLNALLLKAAWEMNAGRTHAAYRLYLRIFEQFPIDQSRLEHLLTLSIMTESVGDIEALADLALGAITKTERSKRALTSGLAVAGKAFLKRGKKEKAFESFERAASLASGFTPPILYSAQALFDHGFPDEAGRILTFFPEDQRSDEAYLRARFTYLSQVDSTCEECVRLRVLFEGSNPPPSRA